ncbi:MAG: PAS domain S-box protein [Alphaproteobacteria bacterium]
MLTRMRKWMGEAPRESGLLEAAFESLDEGRLITDPNGRTVYVNSAFLRYFNCKADEAVVALRQRLSKDGVSSELFERMIGSARSGNRTRAEFSVDAPDGEVQWYAVAVSPLPNLSGHVFWRFDNITARRQMEQIIAEGQRKLYDFFEHAPVGFYSVDADGRFLFINHTLANWLGCSPDEIADSGRRLHDFIAKDLPQGTAPYDPFGTGAGPLRGEVTFRGLQGQTFQADIAQTIERGQDLRTRSVVRDLRPEREMRQALRQTEQRFRSFFEDAPVGIALLDADGKIAECNRPFSTMAGLDRQAIIGSEFSKIVVDSDRPALAQRLGQFKAGTDSGRVMDVHVQGARERVLTLYMSRVDKDDGTFGGLILHALDATEQKNLEIQFAQSQKMQAVGQLAGGIAHDFNNLLTAMIGFCDLLLLRHRPGEQSFADVMQIKQNANRAANLVRQLLAFSRQQTLQPKVLNLTDVLAELSHLLRRLIGENIELQMVHGRDLGLVRGDQGQFEQVIINLAVNARDAMVGGGTLTIRTSNVTPEQSSEFGELLLPIGNYILIEVIDTGMGIPKEIIGRIFEPFFSTKEVGSGTGLGLSTAYGIVKQTGGFIFVDSEPGKGATFRIFLPRHNPSAEEKRAAEANTREVAKSDLSGAGTVLFVEDEDPVRTFGVRALRNKGYKVLEAKTGEAALEVIDKTNEPIDLVITDVVMPKLDGPGLIRELRTRAPQTKIICISGYAEEAFRKRIDQSQDVVFLPKPFSLNQLASKVKEVLGGPA